MKTLAGPKATLIVILVILFAMPGCKFMKDLMAFQKAVATEFNEPSIGVHVDSNNLTVIFPTSSAKGLTNVQRKTFAKRVGVFARDHYARYEGLSSVVVTFKDQKQMGPVTITNVEGTFSFSTSELDAAHDLPMPIGEFKRINHTTP